MSATEEIMKTFAKLGQVVLLLGASLVTGCASRGAVELCAATPATLDNAVIAASPDASAPSAAAETDGQGLSPESAAFLDVDRSADVTARVPLREHVASAPSFHCVMGEESLGCAMRPAVQDGGVQ
jgi:hypothetical protein